MQLLLYACEMLGVEQVPSYKCYEATGQRKALSREAFRTSEYSHLQTWQRYGHCRPIHLRLILTLAVMMVLYRSICKVLQHLSSLQLSATTEVLSIQTQRQYAAAIFSLLAPGTTDVRIPCS